MSRSDLYIYDPPRFVPWDGKVVVAGAAPSGDQPAPTQSEIAALTTAINQLNDTLTAINAKLDAGVNLSSEAIAAIGKAVQRPAMEFRARATQIVNAEWTSPSGVQAIAVSNRGTTPASFADVDENNNPASVVFEPKATWAWTVSDDIDVIAPVSVDATGTTITASWLQQIPKT